MTDYTPTTEDVREEWAYGNQEVDHDGNPVITLDEAFAQFDRWLAAHDRKIAAEALRKFADTLGVNVGDEDDQWWRGYQQGQREALHKASDLADRIEAERQNTEDGSGVEAYLSGLKRGIEIARADRIEQGGES